MRYAPGIVLVAGCSQLLGVGDFQARDANALDTIDAAPDGASRDCGALGTKVVTQSFTYKADATFAAAVCDMLGSDVAANVMIDGTYALDTATLTGGSGMITGASSPLAVAGEVASAVTAEAGAVTLRFLVVDTFTITPGNSLAVTGDDPLVILATQSIRIEGLLTARGAFGQPSTCGTGGTGANADGGGGGGFAGAGGSGGVGADMPAAGGGATTAHYFPYPGCSGGSGGANAAPPNAPGGGIYLLTPGAITIATGGGINAGGEGGSAGTSTDHGGAGGASGGTIMLEGMTVQLDGIIAANGGGGASGQTGSGGGTNGESGALGSDVAIGGANTNGSSGNGGKGGAGPNVAGTTGGSPGTGLGGGGGGGAAGFIEIDTTARSGSGTSSPAATTP